MAEFLLNVSRQERAFACRIRERAPLKTVNKEQTCIKGSSKFHESTASNKAYLNIFLYRILLNTPQYSWTPTKLTILE